MTFHHHIQYMVWVTLNLGVTKSQKPTQWVPLMFFFSVSLISTVCLVHAFSVTPPPLETILLTGNYFGCSLATVLVHFTVLYTLVICTKINPHMWAHPNATACMVSAWYNLCMHRYTTCQLYRYSHLTMSLYSYCISHVHGVTLTCSCTSACLLILHVFIEGTACFGTYHHSISNRI